MVPSATCYSMKCCLPGAISVEIERRAQHRGYRRLSMNTLVTISLVIVAWAALGAILLFWLHGATR
jgi:hypothetical protein